MSEFVVITGMSGAGRTTVANVFDDLGWFVIDNMPLPLVSKVAELLDVPGSTLDRVALVVGRNAPDELGAGGIPPAVAVSDCCFSMPAIRRWFADTKARAAVIHWPNKKVLWLASCVNEC
jgi:hypothetical protein